jgi:hypothetical protein
MFPDDLLAQVSCGARGLTQPALLPVRKGGILSLNQGYRPSV